VVDLMGLSSSQEAARRREEEEVEEVEVEEASTQPPSHLELEVEPAPCWLLFADEPCE